MGVCGVICEYNPFHNGHGYHLAQARAMTGCEYMVCVMSGAFTQRGEPALTDKWTRAKMALAHGADVVLELPALFAVRDAQRFALGGVALLESLGLCQWISFGCEDPAALAQGEDFLREDAASIRAGLNQGQSLARARGLPNAPNLILGLEYMRALQTLGSAMEMVPVLRQGGYHDPVLGKMASATAIRQGLWAGKDVSQAMPGYAHALLWQAQAHWHREGTLDALLLGMLRVMKPEQLQEIADVSEGLEMRILAQVRTAGTREALLTAVKCKRYTHARLSRVLTQAMLGMTKELCKAHPLPEYARLLGFRREAQPLLAEMRKKTRIPLVTRAAVYHKERNPMFDLDLRAGDLWALGCQEESARAGAQDFLRSPVILDGISRHEPGPQR